MQDDPSTNAGRGSNLTEDGHVECDASIMSGDTGAFGAVGAVPGKFIMAENYIFYCEFCYCCVIVIGFSVSFCQSM